MGESAASFQALRWAKHQHIRMPAVTDLFSLFLVWGKRNGSTEGARGCARFSFSSSRCDTRTCGHYINPAWWRSQLASPIRRSVLLRPLVALGPQLWPKSTGCWRAGREAHRGMNPQGSQNYPQCQFNIHLLGHSAPGAEAWAQRPTRKPSCSRSACSVALVGVP